MGNWLKLYPGDWLAQRRPLASWAWGPISYDRAGVVSVLRLGPLCLYSVGQRRRIGAKR